MKTMTLMCGACAAVDRAGLHGVESESRLSGVGSGAEATEAAKTLVGRTAVGRMRIAAFRIGLPDLDHRVGDRLARAVEHPP